MEKFCLGEFVVIVVGDPDVAVLADVDYFFVMQNYPNPKI